MIRNYWLAVFLSASKLQELPAYRVHPVSIDRNNFRKYHHLYKELRNYPSKFLEYFRMVTEVLLE